MQPLHRCDEGIAFYRDSFFSELPYRLLMCGLGVPILKNSFFDNLEEFEVSCMESGGKMHRSVGDHDQPDRL